MISEGSCDTEDEEWSNGALNKLQFKIYSHILSFNNISLFLLYFFLMNASLLSIRDVSQKHSKIVQIPNVCSQLIRYKQMKNKNEMKMSNAS